MIRGRKRDAAAVNALKGNPKDHGRPAPVIRLPEAPATFDTVPPEIADDPAAAAEWARLAPLLRAARVVTEGDRSVLIAVCQQWAMYQHALSQAPPARRVLKSPTGYAVANPHLATAHKALVHCERLWEQLGLTPAARARITPAAGAEAGDPFAEFDEPTPPSRRDPRPHASEPTH